MDSKQKEILELAAPKLAELLNFEELAEYVLLSKLIAKEKIDDITVSIYNLKRIYFI